MTAPLVGRDLPRHVQLRALALTIARIVVTVVAIGWVYVATPRPTSGDAVLNGLPMLLIALGVFGVVFGWQIRQIRRSKFPGLRAMEAGVSSLALFLVCFAVIYLAWDTADPGRFSEPLNHVSAMYFTITVFSTVGFGDITPATDQARALVAFQMLLDLVFLGVLIRLLFQVAQSAVANRTQNPDSPPTIES